MSPVPDESFVPKITSLGETGSGHLALANQLVRDGRYADALEEIEAALRRQPDVAQAYLLRGIALFELGDEERAKPSLLRSLELDESQAVAWLHIARLERRAQNAEAALRAVRRVTKGAERIASAFLLEGELLRELGRGDEALAAFQSATELEPSMSLARRRVSETLKELERGDEARAELEAAALQNPNDAALRLELGDLLVAQGEVEAAVLVYKKASNLDQRRFAEAYAKMGEAYLGIGWFEEALIATRVAVRSDPKRTSGYVVLARIYLELGRKREAIGMCETALRFDPECGAAAELLERLRPDAAE